MSYPLFLFTLCMVISLSPNAGSQTSTVRCLSDLVTFTLIKDSPVHAAGAGGGRGGGGGGGPLQPCRIKTRRRKNHQKQERVEKVQKKDKTQ